MGGRFGELPESVVCFESNLYVRVFEEVGDFSNVGGSECESCPFCVLFHFLSWGCWL